MDDPRHIYLKVEIDGEGNTSLVGAWDDEPQVEPRGFGPVFPCKNYPGCYCVIVGPFEVKVWCPSSSSSQQESS